MKTESGETLLMLTYVQNRGCTIGFSGSGILQEKESKIWDCNYEWDTDKKHPWFYELYSNTINFFLDKSHNGKRINFNHLIFKKTLIDFRNFFLWGFGDFARQESGNDTSKNLQYPGKKIKLLSSRTSENSTLSVYYGSHVSEPQFALKERAFYLYGKGL